MKNKIYFLVGILAVGILVWGFYPKVASNLQNNLGRSNDATTITLAGSSTNFVSLPYEASFGSSTTTDAAKNSFASGAEVGVADGGQVITQQFNTDGYDWVQLEIAGIGGTATSTAFVRLQLYDGVDWSDSNASSSPQGINNNSTAGLVNSTTTLLTFNPVGFSFIPGTSSTTLQRYPFWVYGSRLGRLIIYANDARTDPSDGVQVYAKLIKIEPYQFR